MFKSTTFRKLVLAAVVGLVCVSLAHAKDPHWCQHDWTVGDRSYRVGLQEWITAIGFHADHEISQTRILYAFGFVDVPLPFWVLLSIAGAIPVVVAAFAFLITSRFRRRRGEEVART